MNGHQDLDRRLRSWLDEGDDIPPERYVWAALERIGTTRQRGAVNASLEEFIMRAYPVMAAAVVAVVVIGLALYAALTGLNVGNPESTPTPGPNAVRTSEFAEPLTLVPPDGWIMVESKNAIALSPPGTAPLAERIVVFRTSEATIFAGLDSGLVPWPTDLATWLTNYPVPTASSGPGSLEMTTTGVTEATVAGSPATIIAATTSWVADPEIETTMGFVLPEAANVGTDVLIFGGRGEIRFAVLTDRDVVITYHATEDMFAEATFDEVVNQIRFIGD